MRVVEEILNESRETRRNHLDLTEECIHRGKLKSSVYLIGLVANFLDTTVPISGYKIKVCHACNNPDCCNPRHLYFGTSRDNVVDSQLNGTHHNVWENTVEKYGEDGARAINSKNARLTTGGKSLKGIPKSEQHKKNLSNSNSKYRSVYNVDLKQNKRIKDYELEFYLHNGWIRGVRPEYFKKK